MSTQLAPRPQPQDSYTALVKMAGQDDVKARFEQALGKNSGAFLASLVNTVGTTPALRECTPESIMRAAMTAAVLNLPVDKNIGHAWIIPYRDHGQRVAQFQMGYKGFVQLCLRTGQYTHLNAARIYQGMNVEEDVLTGALRVTGQKINDEVIGCAAYMKLKNGFEKAVYWPWDTIMAHAKRYSKSFGRDDSPWTTHPEEMGLKTVLMHLVKHWGIMSVQVQEVIEAEEKPTTSKAEALHDYIEGEAHEPEPPEEPESEQPVAFDAVACLIDNGISENEHAAKNLLKKLPDQYKASAEELIPAGKLYRAWKDSGVTTDKAIEYVIEGVPFE